MVALREGIPGAPDLPPDLFVVSEPPAALEIKTPSRRPRLAYLFEPAFWETRWATHSALPVFEVNMAIPPVDLKEGQAVPLEEPRLMIRVFVPPLRDETRKTYKRGRRHELTEEEALRIIDARNKAFPKEESFSLRGPELYIPSDASSATEAG